MKRLIQKKDTRGAILISRIYQGPVPCLATWRWADALLRFFYRRSGPGVPPEEASELDDTCDHKGDHRRGKEAR
jgi:hypothetical protein